MMLWLLLLSFADCKRLIANHGDRMAPIHLGVALLPPGAGTPKTGPPPPASTQIPVGAGSVHSSGNAGPQGFNCKPTGGGACPTGPSYFIETCQGEYVIHVGGLAGNLTLEWDGYEVVGTLVLESDDRPVNGFHVRARRLVAETLQHISGKPNYVNWLQWYRPLTNQWFYGVIEQTPIGARGIHGYVSEPGKVGCRFDMVRTVSTAAQMHQSDSVIAQGLIGPYTVLVGRFPGKLQLDSPVAGTLQLDTEPLPSTTGTPRDPATLGSVSIARNFGGFFLTFDLESQRYLAVIDTLGVSFHGVRTDGTAFYGTRDEVYVAANTGKPITTPAIVGDWFFNAGGTQLQDFDLSISGGSYTAQIITQANVAIIRLKAKPSFCLNSLGGTLNTGEQLGIYPCSGNYNEVWYLAPDESIRVSAKPEMCLNAWGGNFVSGTLIKLYPCGDTPTANEMWNHYGDGTIRPSGGLQPLCFNAQGGHLNSGDHIQLYPCSAAVNEVFTYDMQKPVVASTFSNVKVVEKYSSIFITFSSGSTSYVGLFEGDYLGFHGEYGTPSATAGYMDAGIP